MVSDDDAMAAVLEVMTGPMIWGVSDCCTSACDAFWRLHGIDPMAPLRGRYASEAEASALIKAWGGWPRMFRSLAAQAGLKRGTGAAGEIGLIRRGREWALTISVGHGLWAGRVDGGFATTTGVILSCQI